MAQLNLFHNANESPQLTRINQGEYLFVPDFLSNEEADRYMATLSTGIAWKQEAMQMYGREVKFPRLTAWYGDNDKPYSFSGIRLTPLTWTKELNELREKLKTYCPEDFNSVLLNLYRNGQDSISWHSDAERELGKNPVIASVNLGATRKFQLRHNDTKEKIEFELSHGSLLIMQGELQHYWQHQVPKTKKVNAPRINLTFRKIK